MKTTLYARQVWMRFPADLALDIFTLDCTIATVLAIAVALGSEWSDTVAQRLYDSAHLMWTIALAMAVVALVCLLRVVFGRPRQSREPWD